MMWSSMVMSSNIAASFSFCVKSSSARLGLKFPEGWLWHTIILTAFCCNAFFKMIRGSATVPVIPPSLTISKWLIRLALLRKRTANTSCRRSCKRTCKYRAISALQVTCFLSSGSEACLLLPSSNAALIKAALAFPIPFNPAISCGVSRPYSWRFCLANSINSMPSSTAVFSRFPDCSKIPISSEVLSCSTPILSNFSRGRSSLDQSRIAFFSAIIQV